MQLEICSWNVNVFRSSIDSMDRKLDLLRQYATGPAIFCLQECNERFYAELLRSGIFDWSISSLQLRQKGRFDTKNRTLGCVVAGFLPFFPSRYSLLAETPLPERNLVTDVTCDGKTFAVGSFHSLTGVSYKQTKVVNFQMIADWLCRRSLPTLMCIDANTPKVDHPNLCESEWWWKEEPLLFGTTAEHDLSDSYRRYLESAPDEMAAIVSDRPEGPLAVSHCRGPQKVESRYDFIYVSPEWHVDMVEYRYEEAVEHGSDHALVKASVTL